jgi:hypothetical protein
VFLCDWFGTPENVSGVNVSCAIKSSKSSQEISCLRAGVKSIQLTAAKYCARKYIWGALQLSLAVWKLFFVNFASEALEMCSK